jgi:hypothetical protein
VEELAVGLRVDSRVGFEVVGSARRCERWFVKRLRRTEDVDAVVLGACAVEAGAMDEIRYG